MTAIHPSEFPSADTRRVRRSRGSEFPSELSALYPSRFKFSFARFRRRTALNAVLGSSLGFALAMLLIPVFPRLVAPLASPLCAGDVSVGASGIHAEVGVFMPSPRILCTVSGASEIFTLQAAAATAVVCVVAMFTLLTIGSALTRKFSEPIYE